MPINFRSEIGFVQIQIFTGSPINIFFTQPHRIVKSAKIWKRFLTAEQAGLYKEDFDKQNLVSELFVA